MSYEPITLNNTIFYSTANAGYAVYAAVSLLTVRDYIPEAKLCILSSGLNEYDKKTLKKYDIQYREIDLSDKFTQSWEYPIDCYYIFAGPEIFKAEGYYYSVYMDGDILCTGDPLKDIREIEFMAGVESAPVEGEYISIFGQDWEQIRQEWELGEDIKYRKRINSGVVYFNNGKMEHFGLLDKVVSLYQISLAKDMPRKGDDSLFSLLQFVYIDIKNIAFLPARFNYVLQFNEWKYPVEDLVFFHFSIDKPWKPRPYRHQDSQVNMFNPYVKIWRKKFMQVAYSKWLNNSLNSLAKQVSL